MGAAPAGPRAHAITDEALRKVYDEQIKPMGATEEVRARHILFRADPKDEKARPRRRRALAALERIKKGEDFATLANELTEDPSGKENGGDLDYFTKDQMVPEFANIAFQMYPGQISNPVRTPVRLAHHQARGPPQPAGAGVRQGPRPDRDLPGAPRPDRVGRASCARRRRSSGSTRRAAPGAAKK